jgi:hypothetical protein
MSKVEIVGREEILGADVLSKVAKVVKKAATLPIDVAEWVVRRAPVPNKSFFIGNEEILGLEEILGREEICGDVGAFIGDDELALAREGGSERAALRRRQRRSTSGYNGAWKFTRPSRSSGDPSPEQIEELRLRAQAGDTVAQQKLEQIRRASSKSSGDDKAKIVVQPAEQRELDKIADLRRRATAGEQAAVAQAKQMVKQVAKLRKRAARGDAGAARACAVLEQSGMFPGCQLQAEPAKL